MDHYLTLYTRRVALRWLYTSLFDNAVRKRVLADLNWGELHGNRSFEKEGWKRYNLI